MTGDDVGVVGIGAPMTAALAVEAGKVDAAVVGAAMIVLQRRVPQLQVLAETFSLEGVRESSASTSIPGRLFSPGSNGCGTIRTPADALHEPSFAAFITFNRINRPKFLSSFLPPIALTPTPIWHPCGICAAVLGRRTDGG